MPLLKDNAFLQDIWTTVLDEAPIPETGHVVLSLPRLLNEGNNLTTEIGRLGVRLKNTDEIETLKPFLPRLHLIILPFPAFTDGRSYSLARELRLDGYAGELRAEGDVLPDQLQYMRQVGFDSFSVSDRFPLQQWQSAGQQMSLSYQRGLLRPGSETEVWSSRHHGFAAWEEQPHAG